MLDGLVHHLRTIEIIEIIEKEEEVVLLFTINTRDEFILPSVSESATVTAKAEEENVNKNIEEEEVLAAPPAKSRKSIVREHTRQVAHQALNELDFNN